MIHNKSPGGVEYFTSEKIKYTHAFATRLGGVSEHEHTASLNLAFGRGDEDDVVIENLRRFTSSLGLCADNVVSMPQIHSDRVIYVSADMRGEGYFKDASCECDGYVTTQRGVVLGVKTADCVPILLADEKQGVIAALHAGWRGTFSDICRRGVEKMCECGAKKSDIVAVIGPSICQNCYEVGEDVFSAARDAMSKDADRFFAFKDNGKYMADISGVNEYMLVRCGISPSNIENLRLCTYENPRLFFSHRYSGGKRGTMLSVISI